MSEQPRQEGADTGLPLATMICLLLCACAGDSSPSSRHADIALAPYALFQLENVQTRRIVAGAPEDASRLEWGWSLHGTEAGGNARLRINRQAGWLTFFSFDGATPKLSFDAGISGEAEPAVLEVKMRLNGVRCGGFELRPEWARHEVVPSCSAVRAGWNYLQLKPIQQAERPVFARLRSITFGRELPASADGEARRLNVVREAAEGYAGATVLLPEAAFFDAVLELPVGAALTVGLAPDPTRPPVGTVTAFVELLAAEGEVERVFERRLVADTRPGRAEIDLSGWDGRLVRLRLGVEGGRGTIAWRDPRVRGTSAAPPPRSLELLARRPAATSRLGRPDVVLIVLDAARADAFGAFGGVYPTPAVDGLAAAGTRFTAALTPAPWTAQSMASILNGHFADTLGVGGFGSSISAPVSSLAQQAAAAGYSTTLWSQHPFYRYDDSYRRGFASALFAEFGAREQLPPVGDLLPADGPGLAVVHLMPPHTPYEPPVPYLGSLTSWYAGDVELAPGRLSGYSAFAARRAQLTQDDLRFIRDRYQENVAFADALVGRLVRGLKEAGRFDDTLVVLLSDHGEAFLEHGLFLHGRLLNREFLHVPLVVKWPVSSRGFAVVVEESVSLIDLMPTLMDGLGWGTESDRLPGASLLPAVFDGEVVRRPVFALTRGSPDSRKPPRPSSMLQGHRWKGIYDPVVDAIRLYDVLEDPFEQFDLAAEQPLRALWLRQAILRQRYLNRSLFSGGSVPAEQPTMDSETIEQLRALGYVN